MKGSRRKKTGVKISSNIKKTATSKNRKTQIKTEEAYNAVMEQIDYLMKKGESNLKPTELVRLQSLAEAAELYEDKNDPLPLPESLPDMIRMRMYQMHLTQSLTAKLMGVSDAKFSLIMNGKQKPDIYFIKALHQNFKVDANLILQAL